MVKQLEWPSKIDSLKSESVIISKIWINILLKEKKNTFNKRMLNVISSCKVKISLYNYQLKPKVYFYHAGNRSTVLCLLKIKMLYASGTKSGGWDPLGLS